ncbi:HD-GYP domain-containing protein [Bradyrhizobium sp. AUGA SZCCT0182]|uniref:HD-GYP domain-containing protein n=1 Tax=Bradyrhizobium sp. AUGA SZCCT0182 TaxID=2807667 RepID=UPI001BA678D2|nr:HD domain-containing phosphohydrolase [Bradyrhizobium sp. AUGA SZCCT0182]MBR1235299.1 HD domain-containing protein [Bradyrhizobium sp. AUGA SZCCT0182]
MLLHVVADQPDRISTLRMLLGAKFSVSSSLLRKEHNVPKNCDAAIVSVDLRNADNIVALKELAAKFKGAKRKIFIIDQKARLFAAQAYALGATHVLFNPVTARSLLAVLIDPGSIERTDDTGDHEGARGAASAGAASLALMFAAVLHGQPIDVADAKSVACKISNCVADEGLSEWLEVVRRHHEGTYQHCLLVTGTAVAFGLSLGLAEADIERLYSAAMFHDIGKAKIPLAVLDKPSRLEPGERALIETHPAAGHTILKGTRGISAEILHAVRHHHEYLDGSGYPDALCAESISDLVRILTIADIFAALIEFRQYRPAMPRAQAYEILGGMHGKLEAPLVKAFREVALNR